MPSLRIADALDSSIREGLAPGIVAAVMHDGEIVFSDAFGVADADEGAPARVDHVFRIASMTKVVTSIAMMKLVEQSRVSLDATVADYIDGFRQPEVLVSFDGASGAWVSRPAKRPATIRELLSHTGGYGYWFLHEPLRVASGDSPDLFDPPFLMAEPGTAFLYSSSHDVAGLVVEAVSKMRLADFFQHEIFVPLGMADTSFELPADRQRLVPIAARTADGFMQMPNETQGPKQRGGGGLYSTASDYMRLLRCLIDGGAPVLDPESVSAISTNQIGDLAAVPPTTALATRSNNFIFMNGTQKFGLGVMIETVDKIGGRKKDSYGWAGILNTYFWVDPRSAVAAIALMQVKPFADPGCVEALGRFEAAVYAPG